MANLFPAELDLTALTAQVEQLAQLLSDVAAERYAMLFLSSTTFGLIIHLQLRFDASYHARESSTQGWTSNGDEHPLDEHASTVHHGRHDCLAYVRFHYGRAGLRLAD